MENQVDAAKADVRSFALREGFEEFGVQGGAFRSLEDRWPSWLSTSDLSDFRGALLAGVKVDLNQGFVAFCGAIENAEMKYDQGTAFIALDVDVGTNGVKEIMPITADPLFIRR